MAGANLTTHLPIIQVQNKANTTPFTYGMPEARSQTFVNGAPVMITIGADPDGVGYVKEWDAATFTNAILGVSESAGANYATGGAGAPTPPWGGITGSGAVQTYPNPPIPNQPNAVNIALGTPVADGRTLFMSPDADNVFEAIFDNSNGSVAADYTPTQADIGKLYGMTKDANRFWYVDKNKATAGTNTCVQIVGINTSDGFSVNARVRFVFVPANAVQGF
ncbi:MAG TPA: hypothetical protein VII99_10545 [Bacteroidia bacterium]